MTATVAKRAMAMATRVVDDKESNGDRGKSNGNGIKGGGQVTATWAMVTRVACKQWQQGQWWRCQRPQRCGQW
jgi:hypothetical protein